MQKLLSFIYTNNNHIENIKEKNPTYNSNKITGDRNNKEHTMPVGILFQNTNEDFRDVSRWKNTIFLG